ncbi:MAG TPA: endonuclease/exonuclease/phosphatase family protein [Thermoanaerobaculia bacterium]|nr:endonuclease/exonuclease/phosphatase family protein [Thermoanaerobaculia bacterium]
MRILLRLLLLLLFCTNLASAQTLSFRAMTYNIHHNNTGSNRIAGVIANAGADIAGLQEVPPGAADAIASRLTTLTGKTWTAVTMPISSENNAIVSSFPVVGVTYTTMYGFNDFYGSVRTCLMATVEVPDANGQPHRLQFFSTHFSTREQLSTSHPAPRHRQAQEVVDFTKAFPGPRVLVGDFNFDDSRGGSDLTDYQKLTGASNGAYMDSFRQINPTAPGKTIAAPNPDRRFDYVFYTRTTGFNAVESQVIVNSDTDTASDHYPVFTDFEWDGSTWGHPAPGEPLGSGSITREVWTGIPGSAVTDLTGNAAYPDSPSSTGTLSLYLQSPANESDSYGQRIRGYVTAPQTGNYTFWIASDNTSELWLSTDENPANKQRIAWLGSSTDPGEWAAQENDQVAVTQQSAPIPLTAGARYYIEALHKENTGNDHVAVGWRLPSGLYERPIPAKRLSPAGAQPPGGVLPSPWTSTDVGVVGPAGSASHSGGTFTVRGGGTDLWEGADAFHFVHQTLTGDGEIVANVTGLTQPAGAAWSLAGVTFRQELTAGSVHATMMITTEGKAKLRRRTAPGGTTLSDGPSAGTTYPPRWLKLVRSGNVFTAYLSTDGTAWTQVHTPQTVPMTATVHVGLVALRNGGAAPVAEATFQQVVVRASLPSPWQSADVGSVGIAGRAVSSGGTWTIEAGGTDLWDAADAFRYVYQPLNVDGEIVANVTGLTVPSGAGWSLAAVMVREKLTAGSVHASMMITTEGKAKFRRRVTEGSATTLSDGPSAGTTYPPRWLRLTRVGDTFTAYISTDGSAWTQVHTPQTVVMPANVWIGLAVLRNGTGAPAATATFQNVSVVP